MNIGHINYEYWSLFLVLFMTSFYSYYVMFQTDLHNWSNWNIIEIMTAPTIFQGIVVPSVAVGANQGKCVQTFANVIQKCEKTLIR